MVCSLTPRGCHYPLPCAKDYPKKRKAARYAVGQLLPKWVIGGLFVEFPDGRCPTEAHQAAAEIGHVRGAVNDGPMLALAHIL